MNTHLKKKYLLLHAGELNPIRNTKNRLNIGIITHLLCLSKEIFNVYKKIDLN